MPKEIIRKFKKLLRLIIEIRIMPGYGKIKDRYNSYQKRYVNFNIKEGEKVLDLGSGHNPFPLATHLADFYEEETFHRAGNLIKDGRHFTNCNIEKTPFKDKEFDFVYCSHVLEHVTNPAKACDELMRISQRGYIETPTRISDILFNIKKGKEHHSWYINAIGDSLIFFEWPEKEERDLKTDYFSEQLNSFFKNPIQKFIYKNWDLIYNMFLWKDKFNYYGFDKKGILISTNHTKPDKFNK